MSNRYDLISQSVAAELNAAEAGTFTQVFTAAARYIVVWKLTDLQNQVQVSITPRSAERTIETRTTDRIELILDIAVQTRCSPTDTDRVSELVDLVDQIERYLNRRSIENGSLWAQWRSSEIDPLYDASMLHGDRVFTSIVSINYVTSSSEKS